MAYYTKLFKYWIKIAGLIVLIKHRKFYLYL